MSSQFALFKTRRFVPFFFTQFFGAFNDNVFKNALVVLLTFQAASWTTLDAGLIANLAAGIFMLPFFLFSATAGQIADKYDKAVLARGVKVLEMGIMGVAGAGFALHSLTWLMVALFLLGLHSTIFGPVKYAILPQHLKAEELLGGNALVEAGTFASILLGTLAGGILAALPGGTVWITGFSLLIAALGYLASRQIPPGPAPVPGLRVNWNPLTETWRNIQLARSNKLVFLAIIAISWFWLYGALFLAQFPAYAKTVLGGNESVVTLLLTVFTIGIALGSLLCEKLSGHKVEVGLVPLGALGLAVFGADFALSSPANAGGGSAYGVWEVLAQPGVPHVLIDLLGLGLFGGFYCVPLYAVMQQQSDEAVRARIIASNNIVNALFMVAGNLTAGALLSGGMGIPALFGWTAFLHVAVMAWVFWSAPSIVRRFLRWAKVAG